MEDKMPTINELRQVIGVRQDSVSYGNNRTVLNNLHVPVIAYGLGFAGMYVVFTNGNGFLMAYTYSVKHMGSRYPDAGFAEIPVDEAIKQIRESTLFALKRINEEALETAKERKRFVRPIVGEFTYEENYKSWNNQMSNNRRGFIVERFKNGNHKIKSRHYYDRGNGETARVWDSNTSFNHMLETYETVIGKRKSDNSYTYKLLNKSEGFEELLELLKMQEAAEAL